MYAYLDFGMKQNQVLSRKLRTKLRTIAKVPRSAFVSIGRTANQRKCTFDIEINSRFDARREGKKLLVLRPANKRSRARIADCEFTGTHPNYPSPFLRTGYAASWSSEKRHNAGDGGAVAPSHVGERVSSGIFYGAPRTVQGRIIHSMCILPLSRSPPLSTSPPFSFSLLTA